MKTKSTSSKEKDLITETNDNLVIVERKKGDFSFEEVNNMRVFVVN